MVFPVPNLHRSQKAAFQPPSFREEMCARQRPVNEGLGLRGEQHVLQQYLLSLDQSAFYFSLWLPSSHQAKEGSLFVHPPNNQCPAASTGNTSGLRKREEPMVFPVPSFCEGTDEAAQCQPIQGRGVLWRACRLALRGPREENRVQESM